MAEIASSVRVRLTEVFFSLQGESSRIGLPTVFIRLTGCPLRCSWCDTPHPLLVAPGTPSMKFSPRSPATAPLYVCVTGGEPLAQKSCLPLLTALCDAGYRVTLETSGALDIPESTRASSRSWI